MLTEAAELRNTDEARQEAARRIGQLLKDHATKLWADEEWHMDVTDNVGLILFAITVSAMKSASTSDHRVR